MNNINKVNAYKELKINQKYLYEACEAFHKNLYKFNVSYHYNIVRQYNSAIDLHNRTVRMYFPRSKGLFVFMVYIYKG